MKNSPSSLGKLVFILAVFSHQWIEAIEGRNLVNKFVDDFLLGGIAEEDEDEDESPDSPDRPVVIALSVAGPAGFMLLVIACFWSRHWIIRFWNARKQTAAELETAIATKPELWPFSFVPSNIDVEQDASYSSGQTRHNVVCKAHQVELCTSCRVDFSFLNRMRILNEFSVDSDANKGAQLDLIESKMKRFVAEVTSSAGESDEVLGTGSNLTIPLQDSAALLLKDRDPLRVVNGFASICYALRSTPEASGRVDKPCYDLAMKAMKIVDRLDTETDCEHLEVDAQPTSSDAVCTAGTPAVPNEYSS